MASDLKSTLDDVGGNSPQRARGVRIFTYPKIIFIFPSLIMALICGVGMWMIDGQLKRDATRAAAHQAGEPAGANTAPGVDIPSDGALPMQLRSNPERFKQPENMLGFLFLGVLFLNLMIMAVDFPRFTIFAVVLLITTITFFLLWLGMFVNFLDPLVRLIEVFYVRANAQFYLIFAAVLALMYGAIFATRWLDYWEIMPNEILHHHGPLSDLERFPTTNLKFDKEIPDIFEHIMFGAGRLVLNLPSERRSIILDTVLHVSRKEEALKALMSRLEVRVTTDQEVAG
ncbi:hypothetical protein TA3x_004406 [Tundrisphaera sp. TA3]|uniref:hypothetical protein n=1 Tax=Tundrisphaera sp. TA3 TaxID=3435775 RepID=UPI003EB9EB10